MEEDLEKVHPRKKEVFSSNGSELPVFSLLVEIAKKKKKKKRPSGKANYL